MNVDKISHKWLVRLNVILFLILIAGAILLVRFNFKNKNLESDNLTETFNQISAEKSQAEKNALIERTSASTSARVASGTSPQSNTRSTAVVGGQNVDPKKAALIKATSVH